LSPDVRNLLRHLRVSDLVYRDFASPGWAPRRTERRQRFVTVALVSLVPSVGRTALCANLAAALGRRAVRAALADVDPRSTLATRFGADGRDAPSCIDRLENERDVLLVDTGAPPPHDALAEADEVLVVARPDAASLASVAAMEALLLRTRMRSWRKSRARWVVNAFDGRRKADRESLAALRRQLGDRVLGTVVQEDRALRDAFAAGRLVHEVAPGSQVVADLDALAQEIGPRPRVSSRHGWVE